MEFIVKKLGGENAAQIKNSARNIYNDFVSGKKQAIVVSAMRSPEFNTTDKLILIGEELGKKNIDEKLVLQIVYEIKNFHLDLLKSNLLCSKENLYLIVEKIFLDFYNNISFFIKNKNRKIIPNKNNDYSFVLEKGDNFSILGFGEAVSCKVISCVIDDISNEIICSKSVDLGNVISKEEMIGKNEKEIFNILSLKISSIIDKKIIGGYIPVLSGYIGSFEKGIENAIGRGYSDATAAISTVGLAKKGYSVILEVQKSVKGLMSADPRILENSEDAVVIDNANYLIAREITGDKGAQAKLLHPQALRSEVQEAGIKIHLFDPFSGEDGTWIINEEIRKETSGKECSGIRFIGGRKNIVFFSVSSGKMFERSILSRLFGIVKDYFSVDIVTSSETEVSFTVDGTGVTNEVLDELVDKIKKEFHLEANSKAEFVEYKRERALIFCVGDHMKNYIRLLGKSMQIFSENDIDIKLISQGRLERAIIFGIEEKDMKKTINLLHKEFITGNIK